MPFGLHTHTPSAFGIVALFDAQSCCIAYPHHAPFVRSPKTSSPDQNKTSIPPPLNIPPSRARRQLAARLAKKKAEAAGSDPDAADSIAVDAASKLPEDPGEEVLTLGLPDSRGGVGFTVSPEEREGMEVTGLRTVKGMGEGASRFSGLFGASDDSSSSGDDLGFDEDDAGRDLTVGREGDEYETPDSVGYSSRNRRRPSTTEAKERTLLDDDEDDEDLGPELDAKLVLAERGPFADPVDVNSRSDSSEEEELVEIRPRRTS